MPFKKGNKKPEGSGRRLGSKNRQTEAKEELLKLATAENLTMNIAVLYRNSSDFMADFEKLEPKDRLDFWLKCVKTFLPMPQSVQMNIQTEGDKGGVIALLDRLTINPRRTAEEKEEEE